MCDRTSSCQCCLLVLFIVYYYYTGRVITKCLLNENVIIIQILKGSLAKSCFLCLYIIPSCEFLSLAELFSYIEWKSMGSDSKLLKMLSHFLCPSEEINKGQGQVDKGYRRSMCFGYAHCPCWLEAIVLGFVIYSEVVISVLHWHSF